MAAAENPARDPHGQAQHQWKNARRSGRARHAAALGHPRTCRPHRHQIRLRCCAMRRLLGAHQRRGDALLLDPALDREGERQDRHHRGPLGQFLASGAEGLGERGCAAMRLLPVRPDHGRRGSPQEDPQADRQGHRRSDDQHLPVRHLSAHPRGGASGRRQSKLARRRSRQPPVMREGAMTKTIATAPKFSRRTFVVGSAAMASGGLALGLNVPFTDEAAAQAGATEVNVWVAIKPEDTCVIRIARTEMGQGTRTGLAQLVAEELECDWRKVDTESITPGQNLGRKRVWGEMGTGGSRGIRISQEYVRKGGAAARMMLLQAAADQWKVPVGEVSVSNGIITHAASKRATSYGKVAAAAAKLAAPDPKSIKLKDPKDWKIAGKPMKRLDTAAKLNGSKVYAIDLKLPGLLCAAVKDCPVFGGKLKSFDEAKITGRPGVR